MKINKIRLKNNDYHDENKSNPSLKKDLNRHYYNNKKFIFHNYEAKALNRIITGAYLHLRNTYSAIQLLKSSINKPSIQKVTKDNNHLDNAYQFNTDLYILALDWLKVGLWVMGSTHWIGRISIMPILVTFLYVNHHVVLPMPMSRVDYDIKTGQMKYDPFHRLIINPTPPRPLISNRQHSYHIYRSHQQDE